MASLTAHAHHLNSHRVHPHVLYSPLKTKKDSARRLQSSRRVSTGSLKSLHYITCSFPGSVTNFLVTGCCYVPFRWDRSAWCATNAKMRRIKEPNTRPDASGWFDSRRATLSVTRKLNRLYAHTQLSYFTVGGFCQIRFERNNGRTGSLAFRTLQIAIKTFLIIVDNSHQRQGFLPRKKIGERSGIAVHQQRKERERGNKERKRKGRRNSSKKGHWSSKKCCWL